MFQTFKNAFKIPELRNKLLFTLFIVLLYRIGVAIPVPYVDSNIMAYTIQANAGTIFDYFNTFRDPRSLKRRPLRLACHLTLPRLSLYSF